MMWGRVNREEEVWGGWRKGVKERRELSLGRLTINAYSMPNDLTFVRHSIHLLSKTHVQTHKA